MFGEVAIELLRELLRAPPHKLPPYNVLRLPRVPPPRRALTARDQEERIRQTITEIKGLYDEVRRTLAEQRVHPHPPRPLRLAHCVLLTGGTQEHMTERPVVGSMSTHYVSIMRNKRIVLAYLMARVRLPRGMTGGVADGMGTGGEAAGAEVGCGGRAAAGHPRQLLGV